MPDELRSRKILSAGRGTGPNIAVVLVAALTVLAVVVTHSHSDGGPHSSALAPASSSAIGYTTQSIVSSHGSPDL